MPRRSVFARSVFAAHLVAMRTMSRIALTSPFWVKLTLDVPFHVDMLSQKNVQYGFALDLRRHPLHCTKPLRPLKSRFTASAC